MEARAWQPSLVIRTLQRLPAGVCVALPRTSAADRAGSSSELAGVITSRSANPRGPSPRESKVTLTAGLTDDSQTALTHARSRAHEASFDRSQRYDASPPSSRVAARHVAQASRERSGSRGTRCAARSAGDSAVRRVAGARRVSEGAALSDQRGSGGRDDLFAGGGGEGDEAAAEVGGAVEDQRREVPAFAGTTELGRATREFGASLLWRRWACVESGVDAIGAR
jgi:hypothetical protein